MKQATQQAMDKLAASSPLDSDQYLAAMTATALDDLYDAVVSDSRLGASNGKTYRSHRKVKATVTAIAVAGAVAGGGLAAVAAVRSSSPSVRPETTAQAKVIYENRLKLSTCMRARGFPTFPMPVPGNTVFSLGGSSGGNIDPMSPDVQSALDACSTGMQVVPGGYGDRAFPSK